jgi:protein-disulfide isomerase
MDFQSSKQFVLTMPIAVIIAGVAIAGAIVWGNSKPSGVQTPTPTAPKQGQTADISKVKAAGEPFMGSPNAPVTVAYWFDYQCPFCKQNEETSMPQLITNYVNTGKVKVVFKDFQFLGPDSQALGQAARAVWDVAPGKFYAWHRAIYDNQGKENTGWATQAEITSITKGVLGASDTSKVLALVKTNGAAYQKAMDADKTEGGAFGINATPSFIVGKQLIVGAVPYATLKQAVDTAVAGQ